MGFARKLKRNRLDHKPKFTKQEDNYFHRHCIDKGFSARDFGAFEANTRARHFQGIPRKKK